METATISPDILDDDHSAIEDEHEASVALQAHFEFMRQSYEARAAAERERMERGRAKDDLFSEGRRQIHATCCKCAVRIPAGTRLAMHQGFIWCLECAYPAKPFAPPAETPSGQPLPQRPRRDDGPEYELDVESLVKAYNDPLFAIEVLADAMARDGWDRDSLCKRCELWKTQDGEGSRPWRPGAVAPAGSAGGCDGCVFSHLDETKAAKPHRGFGRRLVRMMEVAQ